MIKHLKNFLDGASNVLVLWPDEDYVRPQRGDCLTDYTYLHTDMGSENSRVNGFIFVERLVGQIFAFLIGMSGIGCGSYLALNGHDWAGGTIASLALTGLAVVFLTGRRSKTQSTSAE